MYFPWQGGYIVIIFLKLHKDKTATVSDQFFAINTLTENDIWY